MQETLAFGDKDDPRGQMPRKQAEGNTHFASKRNAAALYPAQAPVCMVPAHTSVELSPQNPNNPGMRTRGSLGLLPPRGGNWTEPNSTGPRAALCPVLFSPH